jgi:hypothetical protein
MMTSNADRPAEVVDGYISSVFRFGKKEEHLVAESCGTLFTRSASHVPRGSSISGSSCIRLIFSLNWRCCKVLEWMRRKRWRNCGDDSRDVLKGRMRMRDRRFGSGTREGESGKGSERWEKRRERSSVVDQFQMRRSWREGRERMKCARRKELLGVSIASARSSSESGRSWWLMSSRYSSVKF